MAGVFSIKSLYKKIFGLQLFGVITFISGCFVLAGWIFDIAILKSILPIWVSMKPNTAVGFVLLGFSLIGLSLSNRTNPKTIINLSSFCSSAAGLLGLATLFEYILSTDFGIDQILFMDSATAVATSNPGRMAPDTALCFLLLSIALLILINTPKYHSLINWSMFSGSLALSISMVSITSYFDPGISPKGWMGLTNMALHTAVLFTLLGIEAIRLSVEKRKLKWHLSKGMTWAFFGGIILILFIGFNSSKSLVRMEVTNDRTKYIEEILRKTSIFSTEVVNAQTATRGFILTGYETFSNQYLEAAANSRKKIEELKESIIYSSKSRILANGISAKLEEALRWWQESIKLRKMGDLNLAKERTLTGQGQKLLDEIKFEVENIEKNEQAIFNFYSDETKNITDTTYTIILMGTSVSIAILMIVLVGLNRQVEKRLIAEDKLRESEERWKFALEGAGDGLWDWNAETNEVFFSRQWKAMLGYNDDEIKNQLSEWSSRIHPDDEKQCFEELNQYLANETEIYQNEHRMLCKDGSYKWILDRGKIIQRTSDGKPLRLIGTHTDITELKQATEELRIRNKEIDSYFTNALDLFCIADLEGHFVRLNKEWETCLGYKISELEGRLFLDFVHPDDLQSTLDAMSQLNDQKEILNFINRYRSKDGSYRIIEWRSYPQGKRIFAAARDITMHKTIEEALRLSQITYRGIFDSVHEAIYIFDDMGHILDVNLAMENMYGHSRDYLTGKMPDILSAPGLNDNEQILGIIKNAFNGIPQNFEFWGITKEKKIFPKDVSLSLGTYFGRKVVIAVGRDISERKKAEEELKTSLSLLDASLESTADGVLVVDRNGKVTKYNQKFASMWHVPEEFLTIEDDEQLLGYVLYQAVNPEEFVSRIKELYEHPGNSSIDIIHLTEHRVFERCSIPQKIGDEIVGRVWSFRDITDRIHAEEALRQSEQNLKQINAEKDRFFSIIAHDLRSPFIGLLSLTEMMANQSQDFTIAEFADISRSLNKSSRNVFKLLNNLLEWSLMQQRAVSFNKEKVNLHQLISNNADILSERAKQKGISIFNETSDPAFIDADEKMVNTILRNLLSNAVKYSNDGGRITVNAKSAENGMIEISVSDTGVGIPEEDLDRLFKVGENVSTKGTDGELSTGLGLILCKEFTEKHGGSIRVESQLGKGSTFYFTLPEYNVNQDSSI